MADDLDAVVRLCVHLATTSPGAAWYDADDPNAGGSDARIVPLAATFGVCAPTGCGIWDIFDMVVPAMRLEDLETTVAWVVRRYASPAEVAAMRAARRVSVLAAVNAALAEVGDDT